MNQHIDQPTLDLPVPDRHLLDEALPDEAEAPWCGSHWADLSTLTVATSADHEPADLLARPGIARIPGALEEDAFRPAA